MKATIKKVIIRGTLAASLLFSGFMVYKINNLSSKVKELQTENTKLVNTEGGKASKKWDRQPVWDFVNNVADLLVESQKTVPNIATMEQQMSKLKNGFIEIQKEKLPRDYETGIYAVLHTADYVYQTHKIGIANPKDSDLLDENIKKLSVISNKYEEKNK
ncbi:hypothetical protein U2I54_23535 [Bacillus pseudomycoides]|uniref:Uncharacterized protein n=1 Tax=Bacillus bingmayongensis TaxID=1150157 RepID=A0ABU5K2P2_9BACI|nr:hypothetical protein [Bacillus pseudomycoides]